METGLCNSKGHKKIATYIRELILILDTLYKDKTKHYTIVMYVYKYDMHKHRQQQELFKESRVKSQAIQAL